MRIKSIANWKTLLIAALVSTLVACGGGSSSTSSSPASPIYTMVFDAGSSGTRINFYKVVPGNGGYPQVTLLDSQNFNDNGINDFLSGDGTIDPATWTEKPSTGLPAGYVANGCNMTASTTNGGQSDVGPCVIQPLLDSMAGSMKSAGVNSGDVKVELFATAGMRTMSLFNGGAYSDAQIAAFYQTMKDYTKNTKGFAVGDFMTSNGNSQEGVWTWVNLNDQYYNAFGGNATYYSGAPTTRGDFEVGGSSMQIAFPTSSIPVGDANNVYPVTINGRSYNVFSKTYLGLGGDDARKFMRSYGYSSGAGYNTGLDCFGSNANSSNTQEDSGVALFNASFFPSVTVPSSGNPVNQTWTTYISNTVAPLIMSGSGNFNFSSCSSKYVAVTNAVMGLPRNNYGTLSAGTTASYDDFKTKIATSSSPFIGLDGFYYTANALGLAPSSQLKSNFTQTQFAAALASTCPDGGAGPAGKKIRALSACPNAVYMNNVLWRDGGMFTSGSTASFEGVVPSNIGDASVLTWTRGYLLLKYAN